MTDRKDLVIIGSGPAGLSAAVYAQRAMLDQVVIEKEPFSGGQIITTERIDNYLGLYGMGGYELAMKFREHADALSVPFLEGEVTAINDDGEVKQITLASGETIETKAVLFATGARHKTLSVKGEKELAGAGVSYCATCDGAFFRGKTTAVVGGGDVALEDAIYLARTCEKVYLIHRRDSLRGAMVLQEELKSLPSVEILYDHVVTEICGEDMVEKLRIKNVKTEEEKDLEAAGIFIAVGIHPNTELLQSLVTVGEDGYIPAGETGETDIPGIYVAGDIRKKPLRQVVTAVADGANAAVSAGNYCNRFRKQS